MCSKFTKFISLAALLAGVGGWAAPSAWGAETATLPGGASSLHETYGDWMVNCSSAAGLGGVKSDAKSDAKDDTKSETKSESPSLGKACMVSQEVFETKTRQRVVAAQIVPVDTTANVTLVLPFGVSLAEGAALQIDDQSAKIATLPFKTCLPIGCVASGALDAKAFAAMRAGKTLQIAIKTSDDGKPTVLTLSLQGLANALDRAQTLLGIAKKK